MSFYIIFIVICIINIIVSLISQKEPKKMLIISGNTVMFLCAPIVLFTTLFIYGGIGGGAAGVLFGLVTFINGLIILLIGLFKKDYVH
ncbi:hypothetical protein J5Y03_12935 [Bacillus sp. RG28]|uniref:Uncharacterized protein n=1 Tax=Gottfriedia endophytica TaxID=2820819 RepID=A0A940SJI8_9BACI|nr:hypothetical protein [Gottfriedia endophytica]MBP0726080.1 hypothetical protein [Gottfriedia endophytica]